MIRRKFFNSDDASSCSILANLEAKYGGLVKGVRTMQVYSKKDLSISAGFKRQLPVCQGGDRFVESNPCDYGSLYTKYFKKLEVENPVIVEIGILKGTGLAVLNKIYPDACLIGLDFSPEVFLNNFRNIKDLGGFQNIDNVNKDIKKVESSNLSILRFDQYDLERNKNIFKTMLANRKIDMIIDDGDHQVEPITRTLLAIADYLKDESIYFVEDIGSSHVDSVKEIFLKSKMKFMDITKNKNSNLESGLLVFKKEG